MIELTFEQRALITKQFLLDHAAMQFNLAAEHLNNKDYDNYKACYKEGKMIQEVVQSLMLFTLIKGPL